MHLLVGARVGPLLRALGQPDEVLDRLRRFLVEQTDREVSFGGDELRVDRQRGSLCSVDVERDELTEDITPPRYNFAMSGAIQTADDHALDAVVAGTSDDPFAVLGRHATTLDGRPAVVVRTMQPAASAVELVTPDAVTPMTRRVPTGCSRPRPARRTRRTTSPTASASTRRPASARSIDPYQFGQVLTDFDLHLFSEGTHYRAWEKLGSHRMTIGGVTGVHFAVWAPNAQRVSVIGDFNRWDGRVHAMRQLVPSGVWEIFIPDLPDGACYKYEVRTHGRASAGEGRSVRAALRGAAEHARRSSGPTAATSGATTTGCAIAPSFDGWHDRPMSVYEVHLGSWRRVPEEGNRYLTYRELADDARALRARDGLHAHRADAGDGASVLRLVGLSGHRLLRADQPLRHAGRLPLLRRSVPPARHRRDPRLGARPLPEGSARPRASSTARRSTSTPIRARASTRTGAR